MSQEPTTEHAVMMIPIDEIDVALHRPVPFDLYDSHGHLVLARGHAIRDQAHLQNLVRNGLYRRRQHVHLPKRPDSPIYLVEDLKTRVGDTLRDLAIHKPGVYTKRVAHLVETIQNLAYTHPDAALGTLLYTAAQTPYTTSHPLLVAIITALIGRSKRFRPDVLTAAVTAGLVNNVGMLALQETLAYQSTPLTERQAAIIHAHPARSAKLLYAAGLTDPLLILFVMRHHERADGTGYPEGLSGEKIPDAVQLLGLVDTYAASILPRAHRDGMHAQQALRTIFMDRGQNVNAELAAYMIRELGPYPVGSHVQLRCGEIAIVTRRNAKDTIHLQVKSILSPSGKPYGVPMVRDAVTDPDYAILGCVAPREMCFDPQ